MPETLRGGKYGSVPDMLFMSVYHIVKYKKKIVVWYGLQFRGYGLHEMIRPQNNSRNIFPVKTGMSRVADKFPSRYPNVSLKVLKT